MNSREREIERVQAIKDLKTSVAGLHAKLDALTLLLLNKGECCEGKSESHTKKNDGLPSKTK